MGGFDAAWMGLGVFLLACGGLPAMVALLEERRRPGGARPSRRHAERLPLAARTDKPRDDRLRASGDTPAWAGVFQAGSPAPVWAGIYQARSPAPAWAGIYQARSPAPAWAGKYQAWSPAPAWAGKYQAWSPAPAWAGAGAAFLIPPGRAARCRPARPARPSVPGTSAG